LLCYKIHDVGETSVSFGCCVEYLPASEWHSKKGQWMWAVCEIAGIFRQAFHRH
jgi:hypothetical protein